MFALADSFEPPNGRSKCSIYERLEDEAKIIRIGDATKEDLVDKWFKKNKVNKIVLSRLKRSLE